MNADHFARLKEILLKAADLSEAERRQYLEEACKDDPDLRKEAESILAHDADPSAFFQVRGAGSSGALDPKPSANDAEIIDPAASPGQTLGPYVLRERMGTGGMGEVWRAEQTTPVRRTVALKLIKAGMDSRQVIARFEAERQALALMDHPVIAKVFDAGTTPQGRPYFAMEYVPGVPITEYCDARRLGTGERLELFQRVCEGVQHAHQKAVIHRDLKPSNILVSDVDGKPQPRIIDFGVAKATTQKLTEKTMYTAMGQLIGTPEYMSPEQADLTAEDIDTRTDVYSLGVILYELLAGALPFEATELRKAGFEGIIKLLREKDPPRPSTKVSSLGKRTTEVAQNRRTEPRRLASQLRGDLDWIVMRSLEKDRNRRYASPLELAQDIARHLQHEPVLAGPPSVVYRTRKFIRRNRVGVGIAATIGLAVILAFTLVTVQNARIAAARDEAELVTVTLEEMLASVDPTKSGRDVTVKEMLDETAKTLGEKFKDQPLVEARLRHTVGKTYNELGEYDAAEEHLRRAVEIRSDLLGDEDPGTIASRFGLASVYWGRARYDEAENLYRETLEIARRVLGDERPETLKILTGLARVHRYQGRWDEAEALLREALEIQRRVLGEEHPQTIVSMSDLARVRWDQGRRADALELGQEILETQRRVLGEEHPSTLFTMVRLGFWHGSHSGWDAPEAFSLYRDAAEISRRVLGEEHPTTLDAMGSLAVCYREQGRYEEATELHEEVLEIARRVLGEEHPSTLTRMFHLAVTYGKQGRRDEAEALKRKQLEISRRAFGEEHFTTLWAMNNLGCWYMNWGRCDEAELLFRECLEIRSRIQGEEHPDVLDVLGNLADACAGMGLYEEVAAIQEKRLEASRRVYGAEDWRTSNAMCGLAASYRDLGRHEEAESLWREHLESARRALGEEHPRTLEATNCLAEGYLEWDRPAEAEELLRKALATCRRVLGDEHPQTLDVLGTLARSCLELGHEEEAETLGRKQLEIRSRTLGEESQRTLDSRRFLAELHSKQGRHEEALGQLREILEISRRVRGENHSGTNGLRYALARAAVRKDDRREALSFLQDALDHDYRGPDEYRRPGRSIRADPDLAPLHGDPEFEAIVEELRRRNEDGTQGGDHSGDGS